MKALTHPLKPRWKNKRVWLAVGLAAALAALAPFAVKSGVLDAALSDRETGRFIA